MGSIPVLNDTQMAALRRIVGTNQKKDLTTAPRGRSRRLPSSYEGGANSSGMDAVPAQITGGDSSGFLVTLYANGYDNGATGTGILYLPEVACNATLPTGARVLAHLSQVRITGGSDE